MARILACVALLALVAGACAQIPRRSLQAGGVQDANSLMGRVQSLETQVQDDVRSEPKVRGMKGVAGEELELMLQLAERQHDANMNRRAKRLEDYGPETLGVADFEAFMMEPTYSCPVPAKMGTWGETGFWVCLSTLKKQGRKEPMALSFGTGTDTSFERDLFENTDMRTSVFDFNLSPRTVDEFAALHFISFKNAGLTGSAKLPIKKARYPTVNWVTLPSALKESGVSYADIVKIDCEGCETDVVKDLAASSTRESPLAGQILMQVHDVSEWKLPKVRSIFLTLESLGYRLFHSEVNPFYKMHHQVSFIHESIVKPQGSDLLQ